MIKKLWQLAGISQCHRASYLAQCLERSLRRLGTDHVDAYLLHDPPLAAVTDPQVHEAFDRLRGQGKFLHAGISSDRPEVITAAINAGCFGVLQSPVNPVTTPVLTSLFQAAEERGIRLMANHVFFSRGASGPFPQQGAATHESLMKHACRTLVRGTILVGTRNPVHLRQCADWASEA